MKYRIIISIVVVLILGVCYMAFSDEAEKAAPTEASVPSMVPSQQDTTSSAIRGMKAP